MVILLSSLSFNESRKFYEIDPRIKVGASNLSALAGFCRFCCFLSEEFRHSLAGVWDLLKVLGVKRSKKK
jgi:hypothetical protein